jgi:SPP1 family predicted phage head-tail adaptor
VNRSGERNRLVIFERFTATEDDHGGQVQAWTEYATAFARVRFGTGQERREAAQESASLAAVFECLWSLLLADVGPLDRIQFDGGTWDIVSAVTIGMNRERHIAAVRSA